jgi:hypothetical protein
MDVTCEGPYCDKPVRQQKTGRPRRFCSDACRKAAYNLRRSEIVWEPMDAGRAESAVTPGPPPARPDEAVASAILEARTIAGAFTHLGSHARPQLAWRCAKAGEAIHAALDDYFEGADR